MTKILLIEDEEILQQLMVHALSSEGYEIIQAADGKAGVELASQQLPDLIISDMSMPKLTGWEMAKILRQTTETANIPIIALTAHTTTGDRDAAYESGINDVMVKPVDIGLLLKKIKSLLNT
jgi:DNA-binding response OmpR family regulator